MKKSRKKSKLKIFLFGLINLLFINVHSQQFIFEVSPGLKFYGISFQKTNAEITSGGSNSYSYENIKRISSYEDISRTNKFGLEPELNVAFFKLNDNWKFSLGLSTYIVKSKINANAKGNSYLPNTDSSVIYTEYISKQLINRYNQFLFFGTRTFKTNNKLDKILINSISLGFGLNSPSRFNTRYEKEFYVSYLYNHYGYEKEVTFKKSSSFGLLSPILIFRYELELQNRKNDYGLFKLNFSYIQGFSNHNTFNLKSTSIGGASMNIESVNRGSGFRIGISKTFEFNKQLKSKQL
jgi:hypothetical protein